MYHVDYTIKTLNKTISVNHLTFRYGKFFLAHYALILYEDGAAKINNQYVHLIKLFLKINYYEQKLAQKGV